MNMILKEFIWLFPYDWKKKMAAILCSCSHQEMESISPSFGLELDLAYFGQWDVSKHEYKQRFENHLHTEVCSLLMPLEPATMWKSPDYPARHWRCVARSSPSFQPCERRHPGPNSLWQTQLMTIACERARWVGIKTAQLSPAQMAYSQNHELINGGFKRLSLGTVCYTAIDNWYNLDVFSLRYFSASLSVPWSTKTFEIMHCLKCIELHSD